MQTTKNSPRFSTKCRTSLRKTGVAVRGEVIRSGKETAGASRVRLAIHVAAFAAARRGARRRAQGPKHTAESRRSRNLPQAPGGGAPDSDDAGYAGSVPDDEELAAAGGAAGERSKPRSEGGSAGA